MNYKVLYRKYRPEKFNDIVGQDNIIKILKNSIISNKISHAYIFSGPRGTGKTSTAKIFAKTINCVDQIDGEACGKCDNCLNNNSDVIEIDAASNNGVDNIREIINNVKITPNMGKYKVYIIDEVHMLSSSAFNALLLTLEEPPTHAVFILATTNIENVPITIQSRCQRFDFKKITEDNITNRIKEICEKEKIKIDDEAIDEISYIADGAMRDALSILDQLSKSKSKITLKMVNEEVGSISNLQINKILDYIEENNFNKYNELINDFRENAYDYKVIIKRMIDLITKRAKNVINNKIKSRLTFDDYKRMVFDLTDVLNKSNVSIDNYSLIDVCLMEYFVFTKPIAMQDESKKNDDLKIEKEIKESKDNNDEIIEIRLNNCFCEANKNEKIAKMELWNKYLENLNDKKLFKLLKETKVVMSSNKIVVIATEFESEAVDLNKMTEIINVFENKEKIVFITNSKWLNISSKYLEDIKKGIKYKIKEEPINKELEDTLNDIFKTSLIEEK